MWIITAIIAYILAAFGYARMRSGDLTAWRVFSAWLILAVVNVCFMLTYWWGPKFLTIWFVTTGIGATVGFVASRALREKFGPEEIIGIFLVLGGAMLLMRKGMGQ